jgi:hypothetical protein
VRLTEHLLLEHVDDQDGHPGRFLLVEETRDTSVELDLEHVAKVLVGSLYFVSVVPPLKEAMLAVLCDLSAERRAFARRVLADAVTELDHLEAAEVAP